MKTTFRRLLGITILWAVPCAQGQQIPPIAEGEPIVRTTLTNNRLSMVDIENDFQLIQPMPAYTTFSGNAPGVVGNTTLQEQPNGFDLIYTFTNTGAQPARLSRLIIGKLNMGNNVWYREYRHIGEPKQADYNNYAYQAFNYPSSHYSPVWTLYNDDYAMSISIQYPIMTYKHDVRVMLGSSPAASPPSEGPRGWFIEYRMANMGDETSTGRIPWPGTLASGETRTYVVSVRVTKNPADWIRTLTPYRDYFRSMYGGVRYQRDPRPVRPILVALNHMISEQNPYGFADHGGRRPDLFGWRPWTDDIKQANQWSRVMLWAPTGLYDQNRSMNYPFQFTTRWQVEARMANVFDDEVGLPSVGRAGISLGLWWGRTLQLSREWNSAQWEVFDPDNPAHVRAALDEMDLAVRAGAKEIGLDTFNPGYVPIWKLVPWLERLRELYPDVKFIIEPITCDILHRLAATWIVAWNLDESQIHSPEDAYDLPHPFYLADLLVPGHESWGALSYHVHRRYGMQITPEVLQRDAERLAEYGFVPLLFDSPPDPREIRASESWLRTLPADVLRGSGWNTNYNTPRAHRQPNGRLVIVSDSGGPPERPAERNGRVGGSVPVPPVNNPGTGQPAPPAVGGAPQGQSPEPVPAGPISRAKKKINGSIRVTHQAGPNQPSSTGSAQPAPPQIEDLPGARGGVAVPPTASGGKNGYRGKAKSNPAWLEVMAKRGIVDRAKINQAVKKLNSSTVEPNIVVVPSGK